MELREFRLPKIRMSLKAKVVALVVALAVFSASFAGQMAYSLAEESLLKNAGDQLQIRTAFETMRLQKDLLAISRDVNWLTNDTDFRGAYAAIYPCTCERDAGCETPEGMAVIDEIKADMRTLPQYYLGFQPSIENLAVACPNGIIAGSTIPSEEGSPISGTGEFKEGRSHVYVSPLEYDEGAGGAFMRVSAPVLDGNETIGVLLARTKMLALTEYANLSGASSSEETYLVNDGSRFVTFPAGMAESEITGPISTEATRNCFKSGGGSGVYANYNGTQVMGYWAPIEPLHACIISEIRMDEVTKPISAMREYIGGFTALLTIAVIVLGSYFVNQTFKPIEDVVRVAHEYGKGNLEQRVPVVEDDELGDLSKSINQMADDLRRSHQEIAIHANELEGDVKKRTAELEETVKKEKDARIAVLNMLEDLNDALSDVRSLDKMKDEFLNNAAHELKTPLIPILGYSELALSGKMGLWDKEGKEVLTIIERNAKRLKNLVDEILDVSKLESGSMKFTMEPMNLADTVRTCVQDMQPFVKGKGLTLEMEAPRAANVIGDSKRITQVITNLINNAVKFTDKGGILVVVSEDRERGVALVKVCDTGIGIKEADLKHMFEKFFQAETAADRKYMGSGLGLSICRGIINAHNGRIWAESEEGRGSTFAFTIPLARGTKTEGERAGR